MDRRDFLRNSALFMASINMVKAEQFLADKMINEIVIAGYDSNFEREKLRFPFGFKGGYLTELWQVVSQIRSENGNIGIGLATQSVLYGDALVFEQNSEANGNALMYVLANRALQLISGRSFYNPIDLLQELIPQLHEEAKQLTGASNVNINFVYNALISVDNALWMLYARENRVSSFGTLLPEQYRKAFAHQNEKVAVMFQISYDMPVSDIQRAVDNGYFVFKIKTGFPGSQEEMLEKDMERLKEIHDVLKDVRTPQTSTGKVYYTMDANGRYESKAGLKKYLDYAKEIGAFEYTLLYEEPFVESNTEDVSGLGLMIAADESIHTEEDAYRKIDLGYGAFVLKGIAKTLSLTAKIASIAHEHAIPCLCADLTVNPILIDWNKNIAAAMAPFPKLGMGMMETNGDMNYLNWEEMKNRHPYAGARWTKVLNGVFELDEEFYKTSGGIFDTSAYYSNFFKGNH